MGAAGIFQAVGGLQSATSTRTAGAEEKKLHKINSNLLKFAAKDAIARGDEDVRRQQEFARGVVGSERAAYAGQGVALDSGSSLEAQMDAVRLSKLDETTLLNNARKEAYGYLVQAASEKFQGKLAKQASNSAAIGSLLGSAGSAYSSNKAGWDSYGSAVKAWGVKKFGSSKPPPSPGT